MVVDYLTERFVSYRDAQTERPWQREASSALDRGVGDKGDRAVLGAV